MSKFINVGGSEEDEAKSIRQIRNIRSRTREKRVWNLPWQRMNTCSEKGGKEKGRDFH